MSETTPTESNQALITKPAVSREIRVVHDDGPNAFLLDTARYEHIWRIATSMAAASLIPKHLKGNTAEQARANCFLVVNQALRWGMDPFAVAPETYEVGGKLAFQGKLVAAVINARAGLAKRLCYAFTGKGDAMTITVSGTLLGESEPRTITLSVGDAKTENKMWKNDPEQKLVYSGALKWARRHAPEIILGVYSEDDVDRIQEERAVPSRSFAEAISVGSEIQPREIRVCEDGVSKTAKVMMTEPVPEEEPRRGRSAPRPVPADPADDVPMGDAPASATHLQSLLEEAAKWGKAEMVEQAEVLAAASTRWSGFKGYKRYADLPVDLQTDLKRGFEILMTEGGK
ncbi:hypothetical protein SAMN05444156_3248 [Verrucomicrobium sp. GAS474]|uniref:hypothetical protein n=1 Tax=Verrucomicrobium sp. GAS474 TaxID=1882831 RepID=UPI000879D3DD|nr:hypothetical protein [Verrucomicrobium sp. GAS474]SDT85651.1 hypothetical protein SAMN05444156_0010 [Verrucomicrobium sp. GAS474]SDU31556.1 hypothetical protein SAMN05444156_3248 [Verrucomicrobium sp. GAS474]